MAEPSPETPFILGHGKVVALFSSEQGAADRLIPRWIVLRALGLIYCSAFISLLFQIRGLIGPAGILPADSYLQAVRTIVRAGGAGLVRPTLLWLGSGSHMVMALSWAGLAASLLLTYKLVAASHAAGLFRLLSLLCQRRAGFFRLPIRRHAARSRVRGAVLCPAWMRPGLGYNHPPSRASLFLLQWEWFRIYFESGLVKLLSGDTEWRHLTAMDEYYQNGPLPTWVGWYIQHLPHWFHWATAFSTLALELVIVWMLFLPRRWRVICFLIVTPWELGVIFTANYTFLNYLVLALGFLLLDDRFFSRWVPVAPPPGRGATTAARCLRLSASQAVLCYSPWLAT